jgi:hypothetical protein
MQTKSVLYAAVGAPVVAARRVGDKVTDIKDRVGEKTSSRSKAAGEAIEGWAVEGEKVVTRVSEGKVVEEISSKVDLDQAKEQVGKLRDQLEDMLATWRTSFRPEKTGEDAEPKEAPAKEAPAKEAPAKEAKEAKEPAAKKQTAAKATTAKKPATKASVGTSAAKTSSAKTEKAS